MDEQNDQVSNMPPPANERFGQHPPSLDEVTAEQLIRGEESPCAAPIRYATLCSLLGNARSAGLQTPSDDETIRNARQFLAAATTIEQHDTRVMSLVRSRKTRAFAVLFGAVLTSGSVAAAATGNLPEPAHRALANVVSVVGIELPDAGEKSPRGSSENTDNTDSGERLVVTTTSIQVDATDAFAAETNAGAPTSTTSNDDGNSSHPPNGTSQATGEDSMQAQPGKATCAEARQAPGANGCSETARNYAPGQRTSPQSTSTGKQSSQSTISPPPSSGQKGKSENRSTPSDTGNKGVLK